MNLRLCAGDRKDRWRLRRTIDARRCNSEAHLGATHVEHPTHHGRAALYGTRPRKDPRFPTPADPRALRLVHVKSRPTSLIGTGGRFLARAGFLHPHSRLYPLGQHGGRLFHGTRAANFFPAAQWRRVGNRLLLRVPLFLGRRGRRMEPRSTARAHICIHLIGEPGSLSKLAASPKEKPLDNHAPWFTSGARSSLRPRNRPAKDEFLTGAEVLYCRAFN